MSVYAYVKEKIKEIGGNTLVSPEIPEKKINNAISAIANEAIPEHIIAIIDTTLFNSAKEGAVITGDTLYYREILSKPQVNRFDSLSKAEYQIKHITKENGKEEKKETVILYNKSSEPVLSISSMLSVKLEKFTELINGIILEGEQNEGFESSAYNLPLSELDTQVKINYLKLICNFALDDGGLVDPKEYAEIMTLIVRIGLESEDRILIRVYMNGEGEKETLENLFDNINKYTPEGSLEILYKSLVKDLIYLHRVKTPQVSYKENEFISKVRTMVNINEQEADVIEYAIVNDEDILSERKSDTEIQKSIKELAAKASAVGLPIAAIYFSGSVVGLSAAGITSGLASLGFGGVLGFSSMVSGVGLAILLGVGAYSGVKKITGVSELENNKQREFMLQQIIKNSQQAMNFLIEDINSICKQLSSEIEKGKEGELKIKKLSAYLNRMMGATQSLNGKASLAQNESLRAKLPTILDVGRLKELTNEATKKKLFDFIIMHYEEKTEDGKLVLVLKESLDHDILEGLVAAFNSINYFNLADASFAKMKSFAKELINN